MNPGVHWPARPASQWVPASIRSPVSKYKVEKKKVKYPILFSDLYIYIYIYISPYANNIDTPYIHTCVHIHVHVHTHEGNTVVYNLKLEDISQTKEEIPHELSHMQIIWKPKNKGRIEAESDMVLIKVWGRWIGDILIKGYQVWTWRVSSRQLSQIITIFTYNNDFLFCPFPCIYHDFSLLYE